LSARTKSGRLATAIVSAALLGSSVNASEPECLTFEPSEVTLEGALVERTYPGPPNYLSIAEGDAPQRGLVLVLDEPICVLGDSTSELNRKSVRDVRELQLAWSGGDLAPGRAKVSGSLFAAHAGHHQTAVLVMTTGIAFDVPASKAASAAQPENGATDRSVVDGDVWLVRTLGSWTDAERWGYYRVIVSRQVGEHSTDTVKVQIIEAEEGQPLETLRSILLASPGYQGYVEDVAITQIGDKSAAISLDIEMKAMSGIVLRDVYVVGIDGSVRQIAEAKARDLDP